MPIRFDVRMTNPSTSTITLGGNKYLVQITPDGQRIIDGQEIGAFIERLYLLNRTDEIADLASIGLSTLRGTLPCGSPQVTAFMLHQQRTRSN